MANYSDLPELIIHSVFQYVHTEYDLDKMIPILGTCRQWRYVGLPIAYRTAYLLLTPVYERGIKQETNIELMKSTNSGEFAKNIHITLVIDYEDEIVEKHFNVPNINFAKDFPNVTALTIRSEHVENTIYFSQLAEALIGTYLGQLKALSLSYVSVPNTTHFPANLTKLKYCINPGDEILLPKINPLPLEELEIVNIPNIGFDDILQSSLVKDGQIHLKNLEKLTLNYNQHFSDARVLLDEQQQKPIIQCPNLRYLELYSSHHSLADLPQFEFPNHLGHVYSEVRTDEQLDQLSQLPIRSIGSLDIYLFNDEFTDLFYQASNRLLEKLKNAKQAIVNINGTDASNLDVKRLRWKNVTKLKFAEMRHDVLVYMIAQIPTLEHVVVYNLEYAEDENPDMMVTSKGILKSMSIFQCDIEESTEKMAKYIVKILVSMPSLKRIEMPFPWHAEIFKMIKQAGKQHPHLLKVELTDFNI